MTVLHRNSKACTALLLDSALADLFVDHSQQRTNLNDQSTYYDEAASVRTAIDAPRSVSMIIYLKSTDSRPILHHGTAANTYGYRINVTASVIQCAESGLLRVSATMPGLISGTARKCLIHWAQRVEGTDVRSELLLYNFDTDQYEFASSTHNPGTVNAAGTLTVGASFGGAQVFTGGIDAIHVLRIGQRFVSTTEAYEDFVAESTPPAFVGRRRTPLLTGTTEDLEIDLPGNFAGPQYFMALAETKEADARAKTALVNIVHNNPAAETNSYLPVNWSAPAPDSDKYHMNLRYLWHGPITRVNRARCRIYVEAFNLVGPGICPLHFRMYSFGDFGSTPKPPFKNWRRTPDHTPITTAGSGWLDLGVLPLLSQPALYNTQRALCALAYSFNLDQGAALEAQTRFKIRAVNIEPFYLDLNDDDDDDKKGPDKKAP